METTDQISSDSRAPQPKEPSNPVEAVKKSLVNDDRDKATDDEMARPSEDRSPLT
jgi:hypothetical protein